jgi:iron complex outermembrane recepter protein
MTPVRNLLVTCAVSGILVFSRAEAFDKLSNNIAAQPLAQALAEFADQTGLQLIYVSGIAATQASKGAPRGLAAPDALRQLLADTGLKFEFLNDRTLRIFAEPSCALPSGCAGPSAGAAATVPERPTIRLSPVHLLEEVIVARPRWWLDPTVGVAPVTVLDRRDIERSGANSIGSVLQALPLTTGSPLNTNVNASGEAERYVGPDAADGSVRVKLHGLATVVLLNGRRLPNTGLGADGSVDLNTLPLSFIDRIEVLASGASAIYGADAVGGVVNIVTRRDNHGLELGASRTITGLGDGEIITGRAAIGFDLLGGAWSVGVDYTKADGVTLDRRDYSAMPLAILDTNETVGPIGIPATPDGLFDVSAGNALGLAPGIYTRVAGATGQAAADYRPFVRPSDGFNTAPFNYSQTPNERASLWLLGSRPIGESTKFFMEGLVHQRNSEQQAAPELLYLRFLPAPILADGSTGIPADNYYNPFAVDLFDVARRFVEAGERSVSEDVELWRALVGFEGSVGRWNWELAVGGARSESTTIESGFFSESRLGLALGSSGPDDSGRIVCGRPDPATGRVPAESIIPGCVPLNVFGGPGSITREQLNYVSPRPMANTGSNEQRNAELVLSGPAGQMLGRDLRWVLGADYRRDAGKLALDPLHALEFAGFGAVATRSQAGGHYDAKELFAEMQVPFLHDQRWAREIALNLAVRWSDYSSFNQNTSWQAGLRWQPTEELTLRANYAEVFRVPTIVELYDQRLLAEEVVDFDPCGNGPSPAQQVNCAANGVPGGAYVQGSESFTVPYGGNPDLEPETGHSFGAGLIYTPSWAEGLSASIDFFHVELSDYIAQADPFLVLSECAEHGTSEACEDIRRLADGRISQVSTFTENSGGVEVRGADMAIEWPLATRLGEVNSRLLATYLDRWNVQPFAGGTVFSYAGNFGSGARPRWRASGSIDWRYGPWMASYAAEYIGSYSELVGPLPDSFGFPFDPYNRQVEAVLYHDIQAGFEFGTGGTVRAAITNITDEDPPYVNIPPANTDVATYRLLGRSYFLELRYQIQ